MRVELVIEQELAAGQQGPGEVFQGFAPTLGTLLAGLGEYSQALPAFLLRRRTGEGMPVQLLQDFAVCHPFLEPLTQGVVFLAELLVECLAVVEVKGLGDARFGATLAGADGDPFRPAKRTVITPPRLPQPTTATFMPRRCQPALGMSSLRFFE